MNNAVPYTPYWLFLLRTGGVTNHLFIMLASGLALMGFSSAVESTRQWAGRTFGMTFHSYSGNCGGYRGWYTVGPKIVVAFHPYDNDTLEWNW